MVLKELSVPEDTNVYGASTEWCEEPYEQFKVTIVNPNYKDTTDWKILLTTIVENLHTEF